MSEIDHKNEPTLAVETPTGEPEEKKIDISKIKIAPDGTLLSEKDQDHAPLQDFAGQGQR